MSATPAHRASTGERINSSESKGNLIKALGERGIRLTRQRRVILQVDELDLLHLRGDRHYYETHGPRDHIHVACLKCGKVREFESRLYEQLKSQIEKDFGMKVTISRTEVGGYCAECLANGAS